jgi:hypothetical protein
MTEGLSVDLIVVVLVAVFMLLHEFRAVRRDKDRKSDHATSIKEIRDARAVFLGARQEMDSVRADVADLKCRAADLDTRMKALEAV